MLAESAGVESVRASTWHVTSPIGGPADQPQFLNGAALVVTSLAPQQLQARLQEIEIALGRVRKDRWDARTIDLDLLLFDDLVRHTPELELPHPRMAFRRFVLQPASEIAGSMVHPAIGWTVSQLWEHLCTATAYVAISGSEFRATRQLAFAVAAKIGWQLLEFPDAGAETPPAGSPSLNTARAIEFLRDEADLISRDRWSVPNHGAISSFWMEDLLAIGDVLWPGALDATWRTLSAAVVPPKLLVLYDVGDNRDYGDADQGNRRQSPDRAKILQKKLVAARHVRAARRGIGPVLRLSADNPVVAEAELVAAIRAMS
jgi:2-amino-4-hydroxy-6-hydroxymethyldihydropteridine diphosphokinase